MIDNNLDPLVALQKTLYESKNPTRKWLHCSRRDWVFSAVEKVSSKFVKPAKALEIGPGSGVYLPKLLDNFSLVTATDIESAHLISLKSMETQEKNLKLVQDDILDSKLREKEFDCILCSEVIEHIPDTTSVMSGIKKLLKDDGYLIITTPQKYSLLEIFAKIAFLPIVIDLVKWIYKEPIIETGHINLMTEGEMKEALKQAGFEVMTEHKLGFYVPFIAEFCSERGQDFLEKIESKIINSPLSWAIWTQCYIARKK